MSKEIKKIKEDNQLVTKQPTTLDTLFSQAQLLIDRKMVPSNIKKSEDVVNIIQIGESLGMNPTTALNSIDLIQGNVALKAKIIPGLLAKHGIAIEVMKDYEPIIESKKVVKFKKNKEGKKEYMYDSEGNPEFFTNPDGTFILKDEILDYVTKVRFKRYFPNIGIVENEIEFRWSDCVTAGWDSKHNWKELPKYMMMARCISRGARIVASDIIGGLYDDLEVGEFTNQEIELKEELFN